MERKREKAEKRRRDSERRDEIGEIGGYCKNDTAEKVKGTKKCKTEDVGRQKKKRKGRKNREMHE